SIPGEATLCSLTVGLHVPPIFPTIHPPFRRRNAAVELPPLGLYFRRTPRLGLRRVPPEMAIGIRGVGRLGVRRAAHRFCPSQMDFATPPFSGCRLARRVIAQKGYANRKGRKNGRTGTW